MDQYDGILVDIRQLNSDITINSESRIVLSKPCVNKYIQCSRVLTLNQPSEKETHGITDIFRKNTKKSYV